MNRLPKCLTSQALKLPERKQAVQSRGQLFPALISVTDLQESGSGLHVSFKDIYLSLWILVELMVTKVP